MTKTLSLRSAAFAIATLVALPALAQSTPPASPLPSTTVQGTVHGTVQTDSKTKAVQDKSGQKPVAQKPVAPAQTDAAVKTDAVTK
jgi:hypothetical protein